MFLNKILCKNFFISLEKFKILFFLKNKIFFKQKNFFFKKIENLLLFKKKYPKHGGKSSPYIL